MTNRPHIPVLLNEVMQNLALKPNDNVIDGTLGAAGHSAAMLEAIKPNGKLLGIDLDETALILAKNALAPFGSRAMLVHGNYRDVQSLIAQARFGPVQAALLDLGYSSMEIDDATRGFSFKNDGPLDMRFNAQQELTAAEIVNTWSESDLTDIIWQYGEDRNARRIAAAIVSARKHERIIGTAQLADIVSAVSRSHEKIHPATRTFQALRIATNNELDNVKEGIKALYDALAPQGRLAIISFHSLEDRIVKNQFNEYAKHDNATILTKKPIVATDEEAYNNPRSRSAKLRVIKKP